MNHFRYWNRRDYAGQTTTYHFVSLNRQQEQIANCRAAVHHWDLSAKICQPWHVSTSDKPSFPTLPYTWGAHFIEIPLLSITAPPEHLVKVVNFVVSCLTKLLTVTKLGEMATEQAAAVGKITVLNPETLWKEQLTFGWSQGLIWDIP